MWDASSMGQFRLTDIKRGFVRFGLPDSVLKMDQVQVELQPVDIPSEPNLF